MVLSQKRNHALSCVRVSQELNPRRGCLPQTIVSQLLKLLPSSPSFRQHPQDPDKTFSAYALDFSEAYATMTQSSQGLLPPWPGKLDRKNLRTTGLQGDRMHRIGWET